MKYHLSLIIILLSFVYPRLSWGQTTLGIQKKFQNVTADTTYFLSYWTVEKSLKVTVADSLLPDRYWHFNRQSGQWGLKKDTGLSLPVREVTIRYRILPFSLKRQYYKREIEPYRPTKADSLANDSTQAGQKIIRSAYTSQDLFGNAQIQKSGSLTRGITIGSNQDLSLESGLRLDLNGQITNDISVLATLTDQNTPIQPDGSTQNLKQFDKVFIQFKSDKSALQLGDIDVQMDSSAFVRINRRLQGVNFETNSSYGTYKAAASVERGKFRIMKFIGKDGVQGPYRLTGANNEPFIIVLAGTEKVYLDGVLLKRGEENDYTIDYSLGEITFTNHIIITSESRITVEYQYLDQNFNRTLIAAEAQDNTLLGGKLSIGTSFMREADSDNLNAQLSLSDKEINILRKAGDDSSKAVVSGVDSVKYSNQSQYILYTRKDTVINGSIHKIYENQPDNTDNVYRVHFSLVGSGNGSYQRVGRKLNGIVYKWVGRGSGEYDTLRTLTPPIDHKVVSVRSNYHPTNHVSIYGEWSGSSLDKNRFSSIGDNNNFDNAYEVGSRLKSTKTDVGVFSLNVKQRYTGRRFAFFDRTRPVEYDRKWNITDNRPSNERVTEIASEWSLSEATNLNLNYGHINRNQFSGDRQDFSLESHEQRLPQVDYYIERIASSDGYTDQKGKWIRQHGNASYDIKFLSGTLKPAFGLEQETRRQRPGSVGSLISDTLLANSLQYIDLKPGLTYQAGQKFSINADYSYRKDNRIVNDRFQRQASALTQRYGFSFNPTEAFNTRNEVAFRHKDYTKYFEVNNNLQDSKGVFVRSVTNYSPLHRFIDGQIYYDVSTERKALLQETYIKVGPDIGQYVWKDLNNDGIQQIDEFFPEQNPNEGTYIKQYVPSDNLYPVIDLKTRFRNTIKPANLFKRSRENKNELFSQIINNLELNSLIDISETSTTNRLQNVYLLRLNTFRNDSTTIQSRIYWRQQLHLFPDLARYDLKFTVSRNLSQNKEAIGISKENNWDYKIYFRYRLQDNYTFENEVLLTNHNSFSKNLPSRDFSIISREWKPKLNIRINRSVNTSVELGIISRKDNYPVIPAHLTAFNITSESRFYFGNKMQLYLLLKRRNNHLKGISSGLGTFELTDGAGVGNSWLWNLQAEYKVSELIRASLSYDGRTVKARSPVQSLRFVVRAVF